MATGSEREVESRSRWAFAVVKNSDQGRRYGCAVLYFAYGSNMSSVVMLKRCPGATPEGAARLDDHQLAFRLPSQRWGGHAADIADEAGSSTWGVLWKLSEGHLETLDRVEARYDRYPVRLSNGDGATNAMTYRVKGRLASAAGGQPTSEYLQHLIDGALEHGLPSDYLRQLESGRQSTEC
ncbi:MAG: gamma-glutamylcyclotransferase [Acidimicrobiia bacterium]|nr:gamma-glutamylcyclotransferase [Acidimicrobiia bacterium]